MITSSSNHLLKLVRSLHHKKGREEHRLYLAEGIHLVQEALKASQPIAFFLWTAKLTTSAEGRTLLAELRRQGEGYEVTETIFKGVAETEAPQGVIAALPLPTEVPLDLSGIHLGLVVDGVQDPGNIGTIVRTAWASGVQRIIFTPNTADPYQGKVVRSSMGGSFNLRFSRGVTPAAVVAAAQKAGIQIVAGDLRASRYYFEHNLVGPTLLLIGSEGSGIATEWKNFSIETVIIPQPGHAESLNVAVSAGILVYEAIRQRMNMDTCKS